MQVGKQVGRQAGWHAGWKTNEQADGQAGGQAVGHAGTNFLLVLIKINQQTNSDSELIILFCQTINRVQILNMSFILILIGRIAKLSFNFNSNLVGS